MKFRSMRFFLVMVFTAGTVSWSVPGVAAPPKVVVSIVPVHSLVAGVMDGVGTPTLLLKGAVSPHDYSLRPSDAATLAGADIVFWIGASLEGFLEKPLKVNKTRQVALIEAVGARYPARKGGDWTSVHHAHGHKHPHGHGKDSIDPHVWLDIGNAGDMVDKIARALSALDAENSKRYEANAVALRQRLIALNQEMEAVLKPVKDESFIVFHDGYRYFESHFGLTCVGAITVNPEQKPSAQRLKALRDRILESGVVCVFAEPQYSDGLVKSILEGTQAKHSVLDPLGSRLTPGGDAYFSMMRSLAENMRRCLMSPGKAGGGR